MNFAEYQPLAARTASWDLSPMGQVATFSLGLVCEATELFALFAPHPENAKPPQEKVVKELGDVLWYAAGLCTAYKMDFAAIVGFTPEALERHLTVLSRAEHLATLLIRAGETSDYMKKVIGHGHELDEARLAEGIRDVVFAAAALCTKEGLDIGDVMAANIAKLKARYPEGFTSEASINRTV